MLEFSKIWGTPLTTQALLHDGPVNAPHKRFRAVTVEVKREPDGVLRLQANEPLQTYPDRFHDYLWGWAKERPSQIFLAERRPGQEGWASLTYAETAEQVSVEMSGHGANQVPCSSGGQGGGQRLERRRGNLGRGFGEERSQWGRKQFGAGPARNPASPEVHGCFP